MVSAPVSLSERVRPKCWADVVGQGKAVSTLRGFEARGGLGGRNYLLIGKSGTGKTSIARIVAELVAGRADTDEFDAKDLTSDKIKEMKEFFKLTAAGLFAGVVGHAWIINEIHALNRTQITSLLTALEPKGGIPATCAVILTTTNDGEERLFEDYADAGPFTSRCTVLRLQSNGFADAAAERLQQIAQAEGLDGKPLADYKRLIQRHRQNMRAALAEIESRAFMA